MTKCIFCKRDIEKMGQWGNNAEPLKKGKCCDFCNNTKVVPERLRRFKGGMSIK